MAYLKPYRIRQPPYLRQEQIQPDQAVGFFLTKRFLKRSALLWGSPLEPTVRGVIGSIFFLRKPKNQFIFEKKAPFLPRPPTPYSGVEDQARGLNKGDHPKKSNCESSVKTRRGREMPDDIGFEGYIS